VLMSTSLAFVAVVRNVVLGFAGLLRLHAFHGPAGRSRAAASALPMARFCRVVELRGRPVVLPLRLARRQRP